MLRLWTLLPLISVAVGCGTTSDDARPGSVRVRTDTVHFELYQPGDETTDQQSGAPGSQSSLVAASFEASGVADVDFAAKVALPAIEKGTRLFMSFGQCYSGGFIDDLAKLGGTQSIITSARHTELAYYGYEPPRGVNVDFTDAFIAAMKDGNVTAQAVVTETAAMDPFGPNPDITRIDEPMGTEHTQYFATGGGAELKLVDHARNGMAVLWAGQPAERDGVQMNLMIERLVTMGFARDRIWLMYGGGEAVASHPVVRDQILGRAEPIHLLAATQENLFELFDRTFAADATQPAPELVFFYSGDHGGLDGEAFEKLNFERPDMLVTPVLQATPEARLYGEGR